MFFGTRQNDTKNANKNRNQVNKSQFGGDRGKGRAHRGGRGGGTSGRANSNQHNERRHNQSAMTNAEVGGIMSNAQRAERFGTTDKTALYSQVHRHTIRHFFTLPHRTKQLALYWLSHSRTHIQMQSFKTF